jgi:hypothetical protein
MTKTKTTKFYIHVFVPTLGMTLYAHTYTGFATAADAIAHFLRVNQHHLPEHVSASD